MVNKKLVIILATMFCSINIASAKQFLPELDEYRGIQWYVIEKPYAEYKSLDIQKSTEKEFSGNDSLSWSVQVKTIFDFYEDKRAERIDFVRNQLLQKIKDKEPTKTWFDAIDWVINKLETPGRYFVIKAGGDIIPINEDTLLYLYDYKISWKESLIDTVKKQIVAIQASSKSDKQVWVNDESITEIIRMLDTYKIKYKRIWKSIEWWVFIWKWNWMKVEGKEQFFINKIFTTPELKDTVEKADPKWIYFWTYIANEDLKTKYYSENDGLSYDVFIKLLWDPMFAGNIKRESRLYTSELYPSSKDLFIYDIKKNNYEYVILAILFSLWAVFWIYLTFNFVNNFKNNFKKTPEEL